MTRFPVIAIAILLWKPSVVQADCAKQAKELLQQTGVRGGLIVHIGCGDGTLTAALGERDCYIVQGLDRNADHVAKARQHIQSTGRYGRVSVSHWDGGRLPYADSLVNLVVASGKYQAADGKWRVAGGEWQVAGEEIQRVLAPGGFAVFLNRQSEIENRQWVKPWPAEIDEWPHYLYGPDNNAVSHDVAVGPPQQMQWVCGPKYARSHEVNSSMAGMVSAGGRLFYIWDEGPLGLTDPRFPPKWSLIARDGFNGTLLWKRPMPDWGWRQWHARSRWDDHRERAKMLRHLPATLPRRLVATGDRLYVTLGYEAPVSILDPATGEVLQEFEHTALADEILLAEGTLLLRVRLADHRPDKDVWSNMPDRQKGRVMAVDAQSGRVLWQSVPETMAPLTLATRADRVFYSNYDQVVCLDLTRGEQLWRSEPVEGKEGHRGTGGTLAAQDTVVLYANVPSGGGHFGEFRAYSAQTGRLLWTGPKYAGPGVANPPDLFVADGLVWLGETRLPVNNMETEMRRQGYDPVSGEVVREVSVPKLTSPGHHYRCYRSKATERYLMLPKRGVEFLDLVGKDHMRNDWLRAPCIYGVLPSNGMLYVAPHQCVCYQGVLLSNFNALAPKGAGGKWQMASGQKRLQKGPAFGQIGNRQSKIEDPNDWPMYRHDPRRRGSVATQVSDELARHWETAFARNITPPVVAGGRLLVAEKDTHTVHALDAGTGRALWKYTAGGRIDSPPTCYGGMVLFGSADGRDHDADSDKWSVRIPVRVRAMLVAADKLFVAGPPDVVPDDDPLAAFEGRLGAFLWAFSGSDGEKLAEVAKLDAPPVYDGLIAAAGKLYLSLEDGRVLCVGGGKQR
jgi:outer membrane protein assembly factor BamB